MIDTNKYEGHTPAYAWRRADGSAMFMQSANNNADAELMADAPILLEEVKRLRETAKTVHKWNKAEVKRLREEIAYYKDNCTIVWMPEDVLSLDDTLTDEQVSWVLERMEHKHDATIGISWDTIEFWISEVKE